MYDMIGDIHGCAKELKALLRKMDYAETASGYCHPERKVIFLGDYIDRGPEIVETLKIVRTMVRGDHAIALMGNHEYNFICMHTQTDEGHPYRAHSTKNLQQIQQTLSQLKKAGERIDALVEWMTSLPLAFESPELRCVHACWEGASINFLRSQLGPSFNLTQSFLEASAPNLQSGRKTTEYQVIETVLKGPEIELPNGLSYEDKDGHIRKSARMKWWINPNTAKMPHQTIFSEPFEGNLKLIKEIDSKWDNTMSKKETGTYGPDQPPVFFGHYWLTPPLKIQSANAICLDSSAIRSGVLTAYRFHGEKSLTKDHLVSAAG